MDRNVEQEKEYTIPLESIVVDSFIMGGKEIAVLDLSSFNPDLEDYGYAELVEDNDAYRLKLLTDEEYDRAEEEYEKLLKLVSGK